MTTDHYMFDAPHLPGRSTINCPMRNRRPAAPNRHQHHPRIARSAIRTPVKYRCLWCREETDANETVSRPQPRTPRAPTSRYGGEFFA